MQLSTAIRAYTHIFSWSFFMGRVPFPGSASRRAALSAHTPRTKAHANAVLRGNRYHRSRKAR